VKKAYFSPVTSLLMSLSLALGILVGEMNGYGLLTTAHAQEGGGCGGTVTGSTVTIGSGVVDGGIVVRNIIVNGETIEQAVIPSSVQIIQGEAMEANGALVGGGAPAPANLSGALVGGGAPAPGGQNVAAPCLDVVVDLSGALVGGGAPVAGGAENEITVHGAVVRATGTFVGGMLTGEDIVINNGVITGQNLLLSGATIEGGSIEGTIASVQISPAD
jgi:hypothetical protein